MTTAEMELHQANTRIHQGQVRASITVEIDNCLLHIFMKHRFFPASESSRIILGRCKPDHVFQCTGYHRKRMGFEDRHRNDEMGKSNFRKIDFGKNRTVFVFKFSKRRCV